MVKLDEPEMKMLREISSARSEKGSLVRTYKGIVTELLRAAHKRECKK